MVISVKEEDLGEVLPEAGAAEASETTREEALEAGIRAERAAEASETTREEALEAGVRTTPAVKRAILAEEGIQARAGGATGDVDPTPAFFIRLILRILWRRVLR
ncbi:MAG: hypothetical protein P8Q46_02170 [Candidatus Thalassarchaeaceae archaeon]|nr:hypothetical protein [Candidatus Thalassarchaeaceae archaeon]